MEHELKAAADYARCSQIWQRVAPGLDPYPSDSPPRSPPRRRRPPAPRCSSSCSAASSRGSLRAAAPSCAVPAVPRPPRRAARCSSSRARGRARARRLQSVHYLLTGSCFPPPAVQATAPLPWREALRTRWYAARCAASPIAARRRRRRTRRSPPFSAHSRTMRRAAPTGFAAAGTKSCISAHKLLQCVHKDLQRRHFYARCHQPRGRSGHPAGV